eukprot:gene4582-9107_t
MSELIFSIQLYSNKPTERKQVLQNFEDYSLLSPAVVGKFILTKSNHVFESNLFQSEFSQVYSPNTIYAGNLHPSVSEGDLIGLFRLAGKVTSVHYMWHRFGPQKGQPKGFAFIEFSTKEECEKAVKSLHLSKLRGRKVVVRMSDQVKDMSSDTRPQLSALSQPSSLTQRSSVGFGSDRGGVASDQSAVASSSDVRKRNRELEDQIKEIQVLV